MLFIKHFRHYYIKYGFYFLLGAILLILIDWYQLEIPRMMGIIVDGVDSGEIFEIGQMVQPIIYISIIVLGITIGRFLWRYLLFGNGRKIETDIRMHMFEHATKLSQTFYSHEKIGGLMSYFINDLNSVREIFGFGLLMLVDGLVLGGIVLYRMFEMDWIMTLYAFIPIALMGILVFILEMRMEKKFKLRQESFEKMSDFAQESFTGITLIKAYVKEIKEAITFKSKSKDVYDKSIAFMRYNVMVNILIDVMISLVIFAILIYGAVLIANSQMTPGRLTTYVGYFFTLLWPVFAISWFLMVNGQAQASAKRIYKFLEAPIDVKDAADAIVDAKLDGSITVSNLTFKYPESDAPTLKDISFSIKSGEMVGILGKTGSGKSTLVELLLHVYNTDQKMIYFNDFDITNLSIKALRDHIGYVPQDNFLYSDTIKNNIGFAYESIDDDYLVEIAKLSDIHDNVIDFKDKYETMLGERGVTVSGGQKQRISIARALAKNPAILILDDSVSAVDTKTEEAIISNLKKVRKGKTTLMIAHRISTVRKLDKIVLLDQGTLVGFGTHKDLLKSNTLYQDMVKRQELEALVEEGESHA